MIYNGQVTTDTSLFASVAQLGHSDGAAVVVKRDFGHVVANQQQSAAAGTFQVSVGRVGYVLGVGQALIGDATSKRSVDQIGDRHVLVRVHLVAVLDGVDQGFEAIRWQRSRLAEWCRMQSSRSRTGLPGGARSLGMIRFRALFAVGTLHDNLSIGAQKRGALYNFMSLKRQEPSLAPWEAADLITGRLDCEFRRQTGTLWLPAAKPSGRLTVLCEQGRRHGHSKRLQRRLFFLMDREELSGLVISKHHDLFEMLQSTSLPRTAWILRLSVMGLPRRLSKKFDVVEIQHDLRRPARPPTETGRRRSSGCFVRPESSCR